MSYVKHNKSKTRNLALAGNADTIYFTTDTHDIILNGSVYGCAVLNISYGDLYDLRSLQKLQPGQWYRITDYVTTVKSTSAYKSAKHPFDILVLAISTSELSENAKALQHKGDSYFSNSKLEAWDLKYRFDASESIYLWTTSSCKGVIYYMKDEFGNECGYDFKNILFKNLPCFISNLSSMAHDEKRAILENIIFEGDNANWLSSDGLITVDTEYYYTFSKDGGVDASLSSTCHSNVIENAVSVQTSIKRDLPHVVLHCSTGYIHSNTVTQCCQGIFIKAANTIKHNSFSLKCVSIGLEGYAFYENTFTKCKQVFIQGNMFGNELFNSAEIAIICGINSGNHIKNLNFAGVCDQIKFLGASIQGIHMQGYSGELTVLLPQGGYFISSVVYPYSSNINISGFSWIELQTFMGKNISFSGEGKVYAQIFNPGDYSTAMITALNRTNSNTTTGTTYEFKPANSITHIV